MQFYERLQELMRKEGLTKYRLARDLGLTDAVVGRWANGVATPRGDNLEKLANRFHVSVDYLMGKSDSTSPELPHEEYREVISEDGVKVFLDASAKISEQDLKEVVEFLRFKQRGLGH